MNTLPSLDSDHVSRLVDFIGYGPSNPDIIFLGIEEAGGDEKNIQTRAKYFNVIEDLCRAHELLKQHAGLENPFHFPDNRDPVEQWNTASKFSLALADADTTLWRSFWRHRLGRSTYETFLMECFPVPRKSVAQRIAGYKPRMLWKDKRMDILSGFISKARPRFLVAYGVPAHTCLDDLVAVSQWTEIENACSSVAISEEGIVVAKVGFFGQGRFNKCHIPAIAHAMRDLAGAPLHLSLP